MKSGFLHAREDQQIDAEPKFHVPRSSNGKDYGGQELILESELTTGCYISHVLYNHTMPTGGQLYWPIAYLVKLTDQ